MLNALVDSEDFQSFDTSLSQLPQHPGTFLELLLSAPVDPPSPSLRTMQDQLAAQGVLIAELQRQVRQLQNALQQHSQVRMPFTPTLLPFFGLASLFCSF